MKHLYIIVGVLLIFSFLLSSCRIFGNTQTEETISESASESTETIERQTEDRTDVAPVSDETEESTAETSRICITDAPFEKIAAYQKNADIAESGGLLLFDYGGVLFCYDKESGRLLQYCFDEECDHKNWQECISLQFVMHNKGQQVVYCAYDGRFYALRGEKLCSFSHDGNDVRIDYSFGENGDFDQYIYDIWNIYELQAYENYLYMISKDTKKGKNELYRYDTESGEMLCLSERLFGSIQHYMIYQDTVYFNYAYAGERFFCYADLSLNNIDTLRQLYNTDPVSGILYQNECYFTIKGNLETHFYAMDMNTSMLRSIASLPFNEKGEVIAVYEGRIYYADHQFESPMLTVLYAIDIKTGRREIVLDGVNGFTTEDSSYKRKFKLENLRFLEDGKVLFTGNGGGSSAIFTAELGEDGKFENITRIYT